MDLTFRYFFAFFLLSAEDKLYLEKKMQPKGRKIALVSDNEISKVWAKFMIDSSIFLQMIIVTTHH